MVDFDVCPIICREQAQLESMGACRVSEGRSSLEANQSRDVTQTDPWPTFKEGAGTHVSGAPASGTAASAGLGVHSHRLWLTLRHLPPLYLQ